MSLDTQVKEEAIASTSPTSISGPVAHKRPAPTEPQQAREAKRNKSATVEKPKTPMPTGHDWPTTLTGKHDGCTIDNINLASELYDELSPYLGDSQKRHYIMNLSSLNQNQRSDKHPSNHKLLRQYKSNGLHYWNIHFLRILYGDVKVGGEKSAISTAVKSKHPNWDYINFLGPPESAAESVPVKSIQGAPGSIAPVQQTQSENEDASSVVEAAAAQEAVAQVRVDLTSELDNMSRNVDAQTTAINKKLETLDDRVNTYDARLESTMSSLRTVDKKVAVSNVLVNKINTVESALTKASQEMTNVSHNSTTLSIQASDKAQAMVDICKDLNQETRDELKHSMEGIDKRFQDQSVAFKQDNASLRRDMERNQEATKMSTDATISQLNNALDQVQEERKGDHSMMVIMAHNLVSMQQQIDDLKKENKKLKERESRRGWSGFFGWFT